MADEMGPVQIEVIEQRQHVAGHFAWPVAACLAQAALTGIPIIEHDHPSPRRQQRQDASPKTLISRYSRDEDQRLARTGLCVPKRQPAMIKTRHSIFSIEEHLGN